jgi:hypothetical protein
MMQEELVQEVFNGFIEELCEVWADMIDEGLKDYLHEIIDDMQEYADRLTDHV